MLLGSKTGLWVQTLGWESLRLQVSLMLHVEQGIIMYLEVSLILNNTPLLL